ncbi:hypothetical protein M011DRAFT_407366 [Sporormia fimetaria CBS 119925]|uniref:Zn(2)-C6 fungal-type domain-containing protein n=1 Tax=Sporormia fimetaria CBS 119925 TaxID=1340428 RepID=A0A6A6V2X1_9PLEO|nr:hypothetical protein M011DRAFT_407366 [Sporormia fimetaria CBS 119925]
MAHFRPLQPAPMDQEQPVQQQRTQVTQKPKRTVTLGACVACRKRKSKCDGARPTCTCCSQKDTECVYELGPHEKPSQAMKRKNEEMQGELSNLRQLYDFLRLRPEQEALDILRQIRDSSPTTTPSQHIKQIAESIRSGESTSQPVQSSSTPDTPNMPPLPPIRMALGSLDTEYQMPLPRLRYHDILTSASHSEIAAKRRHLDEDADISRYSESSTTPRTPSSVELATQPSLHLMPTDTRLQAVADWTDVITDRGVLTQLMHDWYRWEHRYHHFLDWNAFLDDLSQGRTEFCSRLLVNAVLASASFLSTLVQDRSNPFCENIITSFYTESIRLWNEEREDSLTKLQAALLLFMVIGKHGRDKTAHGFLVEACRMGRDLGLFEGGTSPSPQRPSGVSPEKWATVRAATAWSLFNFQLRLMSSTYIFEPILKSKPLLPIPYDDNNDAEALFRAECARQSIMLDVTISLADTEMNQARTPPDPELIETLHIRLKTWWDNRNPSLDPDKNSTPENILAATSALKSLRRLLTLQEVCIGWDSTVPYIMHPIMVTAFGCLDEIHTAQLSHLSLEMHESYLGLLTCLRGLDAISKYIYYAQILFRLLTQACQSLAIRLPAEAMGTLEKYRSEEWTRLARDRVSSRYVADMRNVVQGMEMLRMDAVVAQWEGLSLEEKGDEGRGRGGL